LTLPLSYSTHIQLIPTTFPIDHISASMAGTRSSTRNAGNSSSPAKGDDAVVGSKRKPEAGPSPKRSRKATKKQATLEESGITKEEDSEMKDASDLDGEKQDKV
jgi:hypothetical protein